METNDLYLMRITFANFDDLRSCLSIVLKDKLCAFATAGKVGTYRLELTEAEDEVVGYRIDENIFGSISPDNQDDIVLELYTNRRLAGKIEDIIDNNYDDVVDSYILLPIISASHKIRSAIRNITLLQQKQESEELKVRS